MSQSFVDISPQINLPGSTVVRIKQANAAGFKLIRLPFVGTLNVSHVKLAVSLGMRVVIDLHPDLKWWSDPEKIYTLPTLCRRMATAVAGFSSDDVAIQIVNEPRMKNRASVYSKILEACIEAIREITPDRWIVIQNQQLGDIDFWNKPEGIFVAPKYSRLIASLHYYRPFEITHPEHYLKQATPLLFPPLTFPPTSGFAKADWDHLEVHFQKFTAWCVENNCTPWIGEAGCYETVPNRLRWFEAVKGMAVKYQVPICWWALNDRFGLRPGATDQPDWAEIQKLILA